MRAVKIPVIGIGGIASSEDALEFLMVGAKAIQIGTANYIDPTVTVKVVRGIRDWCRQNQIAKLADLKILE